MNVLDLFSGIGGFSLGLERAGMRTVAFCEIDPYCRAVLAKHWPDAPVLDDVRSVDAQSLSGVEAIDVVCGGFPCQDVSNAGQRAGLAGERSGLWRDLLRAIRLVRPRYAIVENVAALLGRGMGEVLGDLAEIGQDTEWHCIPARAVGAPHIRDRVWIIAADPSRGGHGLDGIGQALERQLADPVAHLANADRSGWPAGQQAAAAVGHGRSAGAGRGDVSDAIGERIHVEPLGVAERSGALLADGDGEICEMADADRELLHRAGIRAAAAGQREPTNAGWWSTEPDVGRVAHGVPSRVDRLKGLGNAVVPQIPEIIGRAIMNSVYIHQREGEA
jgi:DNA (cytosine-5)-methyltransferase 1